MQVLSDRHAVFQERPRPEFTAMAPMTLRNPVTGSEEPYFPEKNRLNRTATGCMVIIIMVLHPYRANYFKIGDEHCDRMSLIV